MLLALVFGLYVVYHVAVWAVAELISLLVPLLIIGGTAGVLYMVVSRKALGGGRRILP